MVERKPSDQVALARELSTSVEKPLTRGTDEPISPAVTIRWGKIHTNLSELTRTSYKTKQDSASSLSLPYDALIHFTNSDAILNLLNPWKVNSPRVCTGTGFYIGEKRILTNCHVVAATTSLRVFKHGCPGNFAARVLCQSAICDLALVTVDDESFFQGLHAVSFQQRVPELDEEVCAVGYPLGAKSVTNTRGVVSNIAMSDLSLSSEPQETQLTVQIDAAINPGNSGGPVFNKGTGEVVGVAFSGRKDAEGCGFIIPTPVINLFLAVYKKTGTFGRLPALGIDARALHNPAMRSLLFGCEPGQLPSHHDGILIVKVAAHSCAAAAGVCAGDILMAIDGKPVSEEGEVSFRGHERISFKYLITKKQVGDSVALSVLRSPHDAGAGGKGKSKGKGKVGKGVDASRSFDINKIAEAQSSPVPFELTVTLTPTWSLLPREHLKDYKPEYCVIGGLVLVIAGYPLICQALALKEYPLWRTCFRLLEPPKSKEELEEREEQAQPGRDAQALVCSKILAHAVNEGSTSAECKVLHKVNGVIVRNMAHLVEMLAPFLETAAPPPRQHVVLQFRGTLMPVVFETMALREASPCILEQHMVPHWTSMDVESTKTAVAATACIIKDAGA